MKASKFFIVRKFLRGPEFCREGLQFAKSKALNGTSSSSLMVSRSFLRAQLHKSWRFSEI